MHGPLNVKLIQQISNTFLFVTGEHYLYRQCMDMEVAFFFFESSV